MTVLRSNIFPWDNMTYESDTVFRFSLKHIRPCLLPVKHMMLSILSNSSCSISKIPEISDTCSSVNPAAKRHWCVQQHRTSVQQSIESHSPLNHYSISVRANRAEVAGHADCNIVSANQKTTRHLKSHLQQSYKQKLRKKIQNEVKVYNHLLNVLKKIQEQFGPNGLR